MPFTHETIQINLDDVYAGLQNSMNNPELQARATTVGYDSDEIQHGWDLYTKANDLHHQQIVEYGEKYFATRDEELKTEEFYKNYIRHVKLGRLAFGKNAKALQTLGLLGDRSNGIPGLLDQGYQFYDNILSKKKLQAGIAKFGVSLEELQETKALLDTLKDAAANQQSEYADAQRATEVRNKALDAMNEWWNTYKAAMRIACEDAPQLLEELGIRVR